MAQLASDASLPAGRLYEHSFAGSCKKKQTGGSSIQVASSGDTQRADLLAADAAIARSSSTTYASYAITSHYVTPSNATKKKKKFPVMIIAAAAGGGLLLVLVIVAIVLIVRHQRNKQQKTYDGSSYVVDYVMMLEHRTGGTGTTPNASPRAAPNAKK